MSDHWHKPGRVKTCIMCGETKPPSEFYAYGYTTNQGKRSTRYESRCKRCSRLRADAARKANPEAVAEYNRRRIERDRDTFKRWSKNYRSTEHGRAVKAKLQRLRKARLRSGSKDCPEIRAIYAEAIEIERIVSVCPVFDLPELGKKMHVDHVVPLSKGGKHVASNLQILPIGLNMRKGTKCQRSQPRDI